MAGVVTLVILVGVVTLGGVVIPDGVVTLVILVGVVTLVGVAILAGADFPAHTLTWGAAQDFCARLSSTSGRTIRLPTESEWEYACRAGTSTQYFWGDDGSAMDTYAISHSNILMQTYLYGKGYTGAPPVVGLLEENPWGLYDILGLISEWTADWYGDYPTGPVSDPTGPATGSHKVARGANYDYGPSGYMI